MQNTNTSNAENGTLSARFRRIHWVVTIVLCALVGVCVPLGQIAVAGTRMRGDVRGYGRGAPAIAAAIIILPDAASLLPSQRVASPAPNRIAYHVPAH